MRLSEIQGEYEVAISLGAPCQVAQQLKSHGLRTFSGPFDWTVLESVDCLIKAIDTRFQNYFHMSNLEKRGKHHQGWLVFDREYQCMSVHDFPLIPEKDAFDYYPEFIEKMNRRIRRFYEKIGNSKKTLFVRMHATYEETVKLSDCLKKLTHDRYALIVVNETDSFDLIEEDWDIPNTYAARIRQTPDMSWQGYDMHWDEILHGICVNDVSRITFSDEGNCAAFLGDGWHNQEKEHRWAAETAELVIPVAWKRARMLELDLMSFSPSGKTEVYCNDFHIGTIDNHTMLHTEFLTIPEESVSACNKQVIRFVTEQAVSPSSVGESGDARILGIGVRSLCVYPQHDF